MPPIPTFKRQHVTPGVQFSAETSGLIQETANASTRLQARLGSTVQTIAQASLPIISEETKNQAIKDVQEGNINSKSVALVAQDVYRRTAERSFLADVEVGAKQLGTQLVNEQTTQGRYDVNAINNSWNSYISGTTAGIKDITIKRNVEQRLAKMGGQFQAQVATLQTNQQRQIQKDNLSAKLTMDTDSLNAAFGVSPEEALLLQGEINTTLQTMVESNLIAPNVATMKMRDIAKGAYVANLQRDVTAAINSGNAYKYYDEFKKMDHKGILNPKDVIAFRDSIQSQISTDVKVYNQELQAEQTEFKLKEFRTTEDFNDLLMRGELTTLQVDTALGNNDIDLSTHKSYINKIQQKGRMTNDSAALLNFQVHILDFTEDEILNSPHLTDATKWDLISQRRGDVVDEGNWLSSQSGREARDRIKRTFNIIEGTLMAAMDFNNKNMQEYDTLYRGFFAEVEALPFEQRASKSISIADKYITQYKEGKLKVSNERAEARRVKKEADEAKSKETYGTTTGNFMNMLEDKWNSATQVWEDFD